MKTTPEGLPPCEWNELPDYPILMTQWPWGVVAYFNPAKSTFILQEKLTSDFNIENMEGPLIEVAIDGFEFDLGRTEMAWGWFWDGSNNRKQIHEQLTENTPNDELQFWLCDYDVSDKTAAARAYLVTNTHHQPRLKISISAQATDAASYMKYFDPWKQEGLNAVCQQYEAGFQDPHSLCDLYIGRKLFRKEEP